MGYTHRSFLSADLILGFSQAPVVQEPLRSSVSGLAVMSKDDLGLHV